MIELVGLGAVAVVAVLVGVAALVARDRRRRNQVVPGTDTGAPTSWAGAHTPQARLHRRLRDAVRGVRAVTDPDGSLLAARVEVERAAVEVDRYLVALDAMAEREAAGRLAAARAAVAAIESAAASLADVGGAGRNVIATAGPGPLPAVAAASERVELLRAAFDELDEVDATVEERPTPRRSRGTVVVLDDVQAHQEHPERDDDRAVDRSAAGDEPTVPDSRSLPPTADRPSPPTGTDDASRRAAEG